MHQISVSQALQGNPRAGGLESDRLLCGATRFHDIDHSLTVPGFCAIVPQSTRTIAILYDSVL
jgi:hypothetical protein